MQSVLGVSAFWVLMNLAVQFSTATQAALLIALYPLLLALLAPRLLGEAIRVRNLAAVAVGMFGAYLTITDGRLLRPFLSQTLLGDISALVAAFSYALYLVFTRRFYTGSRFRPERIAAQQFVLALPPLFLATLVTESQLT